MVAAGAYLVARVYPLMQAGVQISQSGEVIGSTTALTVVTWVGASTALFAALVAVAQNDIKRILAYSTVSQLGFMMAGLGVGGVAVGMFHLITHAFFKALLFLGAGSVIHGCHEEQDIRHMGNLKIEMPWTFLTYAVGMLSLSGFPIFFSGFWSKDAILEAAQTWDISKAPFYMLVCGALLTAFYMMRQVSYVFLGNWRGHGEPHESPRVILLPLLILAFFAIFLGFFGTPAWPWFGSFLGNRVAPVDFSTLIERGPSLLMLTSIVVVLIGLGLGWKIYGNKRVNADDFDALERAAPTLWTLLEGKFYIDELYSVTVIAFYFWWARVADWLDRRVWGGIVSAIAWLFREGAQWGRLFDVNWVDGSFDKGCEELANSGGLMAGVQNGRVQVYLRLLALAVLLLTAILIWSVQG
jgi:NADH-quinone oxidoreductase subunit L